MKKTLNLYNPKFSHFLNSYLKNGRSLRIETESYIILFTRRNMKIGSLIYSHSIWPIRLHEKGLSKIEDFFWKKWGNFLKKALKRYKV